MVKQRRKRGATLAFATVLALVLVVLGVGFFFFSMYMGAQNETKNATDAGALNVAKQVLTDSASTYIIAGDDKEEFFRDCTSNIVPGKLINLGDGKVNLTNINRIWAKALMVAINADGAGGAAGDTAGNVQAALEGAQSITDHLVEKITNEATLSKYFEAYAAQNSTRMIGTDSRVVPWSGGEHWQTSLMDRGSESNIELVDNLPIGYTLPKGFSTASKRKGNATGANNKMFLSGYTPLTVSGQTFWQVPFQYDQKPHLVSNRYFTAEQLKTQPLAETWDKAVPNAWSVGGRVQTKNVGETAMSWVQTNPKATSPMIFPNGFVRIKMKPNKVKFTFMGFIPVNSDTYESHPADEVWSLDGVPFPVAIECATVQAQSFMGQEYSTGPNLHSVINGIGSPNNQAMTYLLQRCKEMDPTFTMAKLREILFACVIDPTSTDEQTFIICPIAGTLIAAPYDFVPSGLGFDKDAEPEGAKEWSESDQFLGNFWFEYWVCDGFPVPLDIPIPADSSIDRSWKPGTGYNKGCLGELTVQHNNTVDMIDLGCSCPV